MIVVQLSGGLGNQLFQYAFAYSRAKELGVELKIDLSFFDNYEWHAYSLNPFNLSVKRAVREDVEWIKSKDSTLLWKVKRRVFSVVNHQLVEENLLFNPKYLKINRNSYLIGYWQSEKYFENFWDEIKSEFQIVRSPSSKNIELLKKINREGTSISLHIRRGNYVTIDSVNKMHGTVSMEYYDKAISLIEQKVPDPNFYVFSDDIQWVKENLKTKHTLVFVDINDAESDFEDLRLMSNCKHNIIANSTFSWWGAYLNTNPNKIVIAPERWFADNLKNKEAKDIIPLNWIKL